MFISVWTVWGQLSMDKVHICTLCKKDIQKNKVPYFYESSVLCSKCYYSTMCVYCDPHVPLAKCNGHSFQRNPNNRFMKDKQFTDGIRFEYESERHLPPGSRPKHVPSKRR
jgi:hypothetical protein